MIFKTTQSDAKRRKFYDSKIVDMKYFLNRKVLVYSVYKTIHSKFVHHRNSNLSHFTSVKTCVSEWKTESRKKKNWKRFCLLLNRRPMEASCKILLKCENFLRFILNMNITFFYITIFLSILKVFSNTKALWKL